jgi:hypothetical protein
VATITEGVRTAQREFRDELVRHGLLIESGVPGVYGRSGEFENTIEHVDHAVGAPSNAWITPSAPAACTTAPR